MSQLFEDGKIIIVDDVELECVAVAYTEDSEGLKTGFSYNFRAKAEVDAEREVAAKAEADRIAQEETIAQTELPETEDISVPEQPKPLEEETLNVR